MGAAKKPAFRVDPKQRHTDGVSDLTEVVRPDPDRFYVLVNEVNRGYFDVEYYESMAENLGLTPEEGYEVVRRTPDGPRLKAGRTARGQDDIIRFRGMVLMSCPKEFKALIDEIGMDGSKGQSGADSYDAGVRKRRGVADDISGLNVRRPDGTTYVRPLTNNELELG